MASTKGQKYKCIADEWLEEDQLMLLASWARDGYTLNDIAAKMGVGYSTLRDWRFKHPEIDKALKKGREFVDYQVENALLKSALGYKTKEVRVTTIMRRGVLVEEQREVVDKEQAPNVSAIQTWLFNRCSDKWKRNRDNIIDLDEDDTKIQVTVTRASRKDSEDDEDWQGEVNESIEVRKATPEEQAQKRAEKRKQNDKKRTVVEEETETEDLDYWPDDWEDDEEA